MRKEKYVSGGQAYEQCHAVMTEINMRKTKAGLIDVKTRFMGDDVRQSIHCIEAKNAFPRASDRPLIRILQIEMSGFELPILHLSKQCNGLVKLLLFI